jgi:hypothetical protein
MFPTVPARVLVAALSIGLLAWPRAVTAELDAPWFGTWRLDAENSTVRPGPSEYARTTLHIEPWAEGLKVSYDMVGTRGGRTHIEWTGALDDADYPVQGVDSVMTNAYRRVDEQTYAITVKVDGRPVATTRVAVSGDGRTLTAVTSERDAAGRTLTATAVYDRQ